MVTFRDIVNMADDMTEEELDTSLYLHSNVIESVLKNLFNLDYKSDEYDAIMEEIDNSLYINNDGYISATIIDSKVEELNKLSHIDTIIKYVSDYNGGELTKEELTDLLSHYVN